MKSLRADQAWLSGARGRVVKIIHLLLRELPADGRLAYRVIFMKRPLDEILASQRVMLEREGKKSVDAAMLRKIFHQQMADTESFLSGRRIFPTCPIEYHDVVRSPLDSARKSRLLSVVISSSTRWRAQLIPRFTGSACSVTPFDHERDCDSKNYRPRNS